MGKKKVTFKDAISEVVDLSKSPQVSTSDIYNSFADLALKILSIHAINLGGVRFTQREGVCLQRFSELMNRDYTLKYHDRIIVISLRNMLAKNPSSTSKDVMMEFFTNLSVEDSRALSEELIKLNPELEFVFGRLHDIQLNPLKESSPSKFKDEVIDFSIFVLLHGRIENAIKVLLNLPGLNSLFINGHRKLNRTDELLLTNFIGLFTKRIHEEKSLLDLGLLDILLDSQAHCEHMHQILFNLDMKVVAQFLDRFEAFFADNKLLDILTRLNCAVESDGVAMEEVDLADKEKPSNKASNDNDDDNDELDTHPKQEPAEKLLSDNDNLFSPTNTARLIKLALDGIDNYTIKPRHGKTSHLGLFSRMFDKARGHFRAQFYNKELSNLRYTDFQKILILYALLSSRDGITLQKHVVSSILKTPCHKKSEALVRDQVKQRILSFQGVEFQDKKEVNAMIAEIVRIANSSRIIKYIPSEVWKVSASKKAKI